MIYKSVEFSYPTSSNAKKMGFNKTGCWTVETRESGKAGKAIKGFLTREEAISHAETMKNEWCPIYLLAQKLRQNKLGNVIFYP